MIDQFPERFLWGRNVLSYSFPVYEDENMPLKKSTGKKAFKENVKTEVKAIEAKGKSPKKAVKQAVAIAYSVKDKAKKKKK